MEAISIVCVIAIITFGVYRLFELYARRKERMAMIEKLSSGIDPEILRNQFRMPFYKGTGGSWAIRIGLLLVGVGLGIVVAAVIDLSAAPPRLNGYIDNSRLVGFREAISVLYPSCAAVFGGIGLVIAYFIEKKNGKSSENE